VCFIGPQVNRAVDDARVCHPGPLVRC
jgi:hypothetical protein